MSKAFIIVIGVSVFILGTLGQPTVNKLGRFIKNEINLLQSLEKHIHFRENLLQKISSHFKSLSGVVFGRGSRDEYLSNPLNTLTLVHRLTTDWPVLANLMRDKSGWSVELNNWTTQTDLELVARNLGRAQTTYNLSTDHLAVGLLDGKPVNANITGADCYLIARHYYLKYHHSEAVEWLDQALAKHDNTVPRDWLLELAVLSSYFSGQSNKSSSILSMLLREYPGHKTSRGLVQDWQFMVNTDFDEAQATMAEKKKLALPMKYHLTKAYNKLCQENYKIDPNLKCRYVHYNKNHLRLAPFRLEELHLDPPVVVFHNAINKVEIQEAKRKVYDKLKKSVVLAKNGTLHEDPYRTSESAFVYPGQSDILDKLSKKTGIMTNFDMKFSEPDQITRYGLSGEFLFHRDFFGEIPKKAESGERIATLLFYLSDVDRGGHTAFLNWELSVKPQKGSAVLWFNIKRDGSLDYNSMHASCSVLKGTKWVLTKLFHELNNDVTMPCDVDREKSYKYFYL